MLLKNLLFKPNNATSFFNSYKFAAIKNSNKKQRTLYQILQVPSTAPQTNIRKNYLKLAKIYHPDVYKGSDKNRFENIQKAYETLSNVRQRQKYDVEIGLRKPSYQDDINPRTDGREDPSDQQLNKRNDFTYDQSKEVKQDVDLDAEYEKFFKKKKQTDFEEIRLHQQGQFRAMNEDERIRFRFRQLYENEGAQQKIGNQKPFQDMLDDQIDQRNTHHEDIKIKKEKLKKLYSEQGIKKQTYLVYFMGFIVALVFYPLLISFWTKYRLEQEQKQKLLKLMQKISIKKQEAQIRSRFQY